MEEDLFLSCLQQFFNPLIKLKHDLSLDQKPFVLCRQKIFLLDTPKINSQKFVSKFYQSFIILIFYSFTTSIVWTHPQLTQNWSNSCAVAFNSKVRNVSQMRYAVSSLEVLASMSNFLRKF